MSPSSTTPTSISVVTIGSCTCGWNVKASMPARACAPVHNQLLWSEPSDSTWKSLQLNSGKTYFSLTVKQGIAQYLTARATDVELVLITRDRYITLRSQLRYWLEFIGKDTKLKGLDSTDCENYFQYRNGITSYLVGLLRISPAA